MRLHPRTRPSRPEPEAEHLTKGATQTPQASPFQKDGTAGLGEAETQVLEVGPGLPPVASSSSVWRPLRRQELSPPLRNPSRVCLPPPPSVAQTTEPPSSSPLSLLPASSVPFPRENRRKVPQSKSGHVALLLRIPPWLRASLPVATEPLTAAQGRPGGLSALGSRPDRAAQPAPACSRRSHCPLRPPGRLGRLSLCCRCPTDTRSRTPPPPGSPHGLIPGSPAPQRRPRSEPTCAPGSAASACAVLRRPGAGGFAVHGSRFDFGSDSRSVACGACDQPTASASVCPDPSAETAAAALTQYPGPAPGAFLPCGARQAAPPAPEPREGNLCRCPVPPGLRRPVTSPLPSSVARVTASGQASVSRVEDSPFRQY